MKKLLTIIFVLSFNLSFSQSITWFGGITAKSDTKFDKGGFGFNFGGGLKTENELPKYVAIGLQYSFDYYIGDQSNKNNFVNTSIPHSDYTESIQNNFDLNLYGVVHLIPIKKFNIYSGGGINLLSGLKIQHSKVTGLDWNGGNTFEALPTFIAGLQLFPFEKAYFLSFEFNKDKYNETYLFRFGIRTK